MGGIAVIRELFHAEIAEGRRGAESLRTFGKYPRFKGKKEASALRTEAARDGLRQELHLPTRSG
jgi:hypothetical protein